MRRRPPITIIDESGFRKMIEGGQVLASAHRMPAVILDAGQQRLIKVWHRERGLTSDRIRPYAYRFYFNSQRLLELGIPAPDIEAFYEMRPGGQHVIVYRYLRGVGVETLLEQGGGLSLAALAAFYAELHKRGVYFRSIHPGNILKLDDRHFGLIDVTDVRFYAKPLSVQRRVRNLLYAWTRKRHRRLFPAERVSVLLEAYRRCAGLDARAEANFIKHMRQGLSQAGITVT